MFLTARFTCSSMTRFRIQEGNLPWRTLNLEESESAWVTPGQGQLKKLIFGCDSVEPYLTNAVSMILLGPPCRNTMRVNL
jgi:hypothetical protein